MATITRALGGLRRMNNNKTVEQHRKEVKESQRERNELELYPLSSYSTTQLKKELRRRKGKY